MSNILVLLCYPTITHYPLHCTGSLAILHTMFRVSTQFAAEVTAIFISMYALGRLFSGFLAQKIGSIGAYFVLIVTMAVALLLAPQTAVYLPHDSSESVGCKLFIVLIAIIGKKLTSPTSCIFETSDLIELTALDFLWFRIVLRWLPSFILFHRFRLFRLS